MAFVITMVTMQVLGEREFIHSKVVGTLGDESVEFVPLSIV